jgi:hypothetical protein
MLYVSNPCASIMTKIRIEKTGAIPIKIEGLQYANDHESREVQWIRVGMITARRIIENAPMGENDRRRGETCHHVKALKSRFGRHFPWITLARVTPQPSSRRSFNPHWRIVVSSHRIDKHSVIVRWRRTMKFHARGRERR